MHTSLPRLGCSNHLLMPLFLLEHSPSRQCCPVCGSLFKAYQADVGYFTALHSDCTCAGTSWEMLYWSSAENFLFKKIKIPSIWGKKMRTVCSRCTAKVQREQGGCAEWAAVQSWLQPNEPPGELGCAMGAQLDLTGMQNKAEKLVMS